MKFKTKLLLTLICFACSHNGFAQFDNESFKRFGVIAGANVSNMNFNNSVTAPATPVPSSWKPGITIGLLVNVPLIENLVLQPEYHYTQRKGANKSNDTKYSNTYLSLPVLLSYKITPRIAIIAGPQVDLLISATENKTGFVTTITRDVEERSISAVAGVEIDIVRSFFFSVRYMHGLNHIGIGQRSNVTEFKYQGATILAGYRF